MIKSLSTTNTKSKKVRFVADEAKLFQRCLDLYLPMNIGLTHKISILLSGLIRKKYLTTGCI